MPRLLNVCLIRLLAYKIYLCPAKCPRRYTWCNVKSKQRFMSWGRCPNPKTLSNQFINLFIQGHTDISQWMLVTLYVIIHKSRIAYLSTLRTKKIQTIYNIHENTSNIWLKKQKYWLEIISEIRIAFYCFMISFMYIFFCF